MSGHEEITGSEKIYDGSILNLRVDTVKLPDGSSHEREIIEHLGAVAMVPLDDDGNVIMVRQYRSAAENDLLEIPAGGLVEGEDREACAQRELQEEIGYRAGTLIKLGDFWVAASYTTELITVYLATDLEESSLPGDLDERIELVRMPFNDALQQVLSNEITDAKTLIGITWAAHYIKDKAGS